MKLKTRIIVGFGMSILVPLLLFSATLYGLGHTKFAQQTKDSSEVVYDISVGESTHSQTQVRIIAKDLLFTATVILVFTALSIGLWIYRSIATPLVKLKKATQNIKEGNLDFVLEVDGDDEFSELCRDFEEMRKRLKESAEEKVLMDKENKELISNISHDLKTPITAVKGYVEGIMDGVADTPEKIDRYVKTIYNKTNEMDHLINELTFYSKIDTNRIPYTFSKLNVEDYFSDCAEEVGLELETRGIRTAFFMAIRLILLIMGTSVLTLTTSPIELTDGIERLLKPIGKEIAHELAMMMTIALRFIPTLIDETDKIMKAQKARGADFESGGLVQKAKSLIPLLVPLFISSFRRADELAMAMEARCYRGGAGRTRMKVLKFTSKDFVAFGVFALLFASTLIVRFAI